MLAVFVTGLFSCTVAELKSVGRRQFRLRLFLLHFDCG
jgi:hypothetical protein